MAHMPFALTVTVFRATDLPVADLLSSDPFVSLCLGDKEFGKTSTKFKNHKRPEWNEVFETSLLFLHQNLELRIFDDDHLTYKDHDLLGTVVIPLAELPINNFNRQSYAVMNAGGFRAKATLEVEIMVRRNDALITLSSQSSQILSKHDSLQRMSLESVNELGSHWLWADTPDIVRHTLLDQAVQGNTLYASKDLLLDLLLDAYVLDPTVVSSKRFQEPILSSLRRNEQRVQCSVWQSLDDPRITQRHPPIGITTLQLLCPQHKVVTLHFPSKVTMWTWALWIQSANSIWKSSTARNRWPAHCVAGRVTNLKAKLKITSPTLPVEELEGVTLDLEKPFLFIAGGRAVGVHGMDAMVIGCDSTIPKPFAMEVQVVKVSFVPAATASPKPRTKLPNLNFNFNALGHGAKPAGPPMLMLVEGTHGYTHSPGASDSSVSMVIDVCLSDLVPTDRFFQDPASPGGAGAPSGIESAAILPARSLPSSTLLPSFDLYVTQGDQIVAQKACKLQTLLPSRRMSAMDLLHPSFLSEEWTEVTIPLDTQVIELEVQLVRFEDFSVSAVDSTLVLRATLADEAGAAVSETKKSLAMKPSVFRGASEATSNMVSVRFDSAQSRLHRCRYVLVEFAAAAANVHTKPLGQLVLPVDYFVGISEEYVCELSGAVGKAVVAIKKIVVTEDEGAQSIVTLRSRCFENNLVNNLWLGETMADVGGHAKMGTGTAEDEAQVVAQAKQWEVALLPDGLTMRQLSSSSGGTGVSPHLTFPWDHVGDVTVLTMSVVVLHLLDGVGGIERKPGPMVFVSNVPALEVLSLIEERKMFWAYKQVFRDLASVNNLTGSIKHPLAGQRFKAASAADDLAGTVTTSRGAQLLDSLYTVTAQVESQLARIKQSLDQSSSRNHGDALKEEKVLTRRLLRLHLYKARLYSLGLSAEDAYDFEDEEDTKHLVESDLYRVQCFQFEDLVTTANTRIQYLLDLAEKRIYEIALMGWNAFHGGAELRRKVVRCFEIICSGYYSEIVSILTAVFDNTAESDIKGLRNKLQLLHTFMAHDDKLHLMVLRAFEPYHLVPSAPVLLSVYLNPTILYTWYSAELTEEMRLRIDQVLSVWKDAERCGSDNIQVYRYPLPWYPHQLLGLGQAASTDASGAQFYTNITKDCVDLLLHYIREAKLDKDNTSATYHKHIDQLDQKVCLAYLSAFLYLSQVYLHALQEKEAGWMAMPMEEFDEYTTFLFSVINDATRIGCDDALCMLELPVDRRIAQSEEVLRLTHKTLLSFSEARMLALDQLSGMLLLYALDQDDRKMLQDGTALLHAYLQTISTDHEVSEETTAEEGGHTFFRKLFTSVHRGLEDSQDFLDAEGYRSLREVCIGKLTMLWLALVRSIAEAKMVLSPDDELVTALCQDALWLQGATAAGQKRDAESSSPPPLVSLAFLSNFSILLSDHSLLALDQGIYVLQQELSHQEGLSGDDVLAYGAAIKACLAVRGIELSRTPLLPAATTHGAIGGGPVHGCKDVRATSSDKGNGVDAAAKKRSSFSLLNKLQQTKQKIKGAVRRLGRHDGATAGDDAPKSIEELAMEDELGQSLNAFLDASTKLPKLSKTPIGHALKHPTALIFAPRTSPLPLDTLLLASFTQREAAIRQALSQAKPGLLPSLLPRLPLLGTHPAGAGRDEEDDYSKRSLLRKVKGAVAQALRKIDQKLSKEDDGDAPVNNVAIQANPDAALPDLLVVFKDLKASNLFYLDTIHPPKPYLAIKYGGLVKRTVARGVCTAASWVDEDIAFPVSLRPADAQDGAVTIKVLLYYEGYRYDHLVGTVRVRLDLRNLAPFENRGHVIAEFGTEAERAKNKADKEGRGLPTLTFSMWPSEIHSLN